MGEREPICLYDIAEVVDCESEAVLAKENPLVLDALVASCRGFGLTRDIGSKRMLLDCQVEGCGASCVAVKYDNDFFYVEDPEDPADGATASNLERDCRNLHDD